MPKREMVQLPAFSGIPKEGLTFLSQLEKNNNREWFLEHKSEFEEHLLLPMRSLVALVRDILAPIAPSFRIDPMKSIHRIHRDIRFSRDKSPYKTHLAASFIDRSSGHSDGLYLSLSANGSASGGGVYMPSSAELKLIRQQISDHGKSFRSIVEDEQLKQRFGVMRGSQLQRPPMGFSADDAMLDYLKYKQFFFIRDYKKEDCLKADFGERIAADYLCLLPFVDWISKATKGKS